MIKNILFIHQSAELYGSDKTLLTLVKEVNNHPQFHPIVVLPQNGLLSDVLKKEGVEVIVSPVLKLSRATFKPGNVLKLGYEIFSVVKKLKEKIGGREIHLVHSNTLAVLLGAFYTRKYRIKHLWHVHEIIQNPNIAQKIFRFFITNFSDIVVYNSKATLGFWTTNSKLKERSKLILNGVNRSEPFANHERISYIRENYFSLQKDERVLCLIGRINHMKGHALLLEAFDFLKNDFPKTKLVFIGSVFKGNEMIKETLLSKIQQMNLEDRVKILPFQENIWEFWDSIDLAVVPSTQPESFGLVALEAMLAKKPVIAANHGGLIEIVDDNMTGCFFKPNDVKDLELKLRMLLKDESKMKKMGEEGYKRAIEIFSEKSYLSQFIELYKSTTH